MKSYVKKLNKLIFIISAVLVCVALFAVPCYASGTGKVIFEAISDTNSNPVSDLEIAVYKIGKITTVGEYILNDDLIQIVDRNALSNYKEDDINKIVEYVKANYEKQLKLTTDNNGRYVKNDIEEGIYLFIQNDSFDTCTMQNALAVVKAGETSKVEPKIVSIIKPVETETQISEIDENEVLPNTGILYWPIPVFSILGILIFATGWYILFATNSSKKKAGIAVISVSLVLIVIAGGILTYNNIENNRVLEENMIVVENIEKEIDNKLNNDEEQKQQVNNEISKEYIEYDGNKYIGVLYIPSLNNLRIPVLAECTDYNLKKSICKYSGSVDDRLVIAGHNYKSIFGKLLNVKNLDETVYLRTLNGEFVKYKLNEIENLEISEVKKMKEEPYDLTLFTCTYDGSLRRTLRFVKV